MKLRRALHLATHAARENLWPGLLLQAIFAVFLAAYLWHEGTREALGAVARFKVASGFAFAFVSYVLAAAVLPEVLRVVFFQGGRVNRTNVWNAATAAPFWGLMGVVVDAFYRLQGVWFGTEADWQTLALKVAVDQFIYSPFFGAPVMVAYFLWRDDRFRARAWREVFSWSFVVERVFPVQVAGWMIWIPGVTLVYFMPPALQLPVAVMIQCFWILVFTTIQARAGRAAAGN